MKCIKKSISLPEQLSKALDAVAKVKIRNRSEQIKESLMNDPDIREVLKGMKE